MYYLHREEVIRMTANQIAWATLVETERSNRVREAETQRHNEAGEYETRRHNEAGEVEMYRHNAMTEQEFNRHNVAMETSALLTLGEQVRHNKASELLDSRRISESSRHNRMMENLERGNQRLKSMQLSLQRQKQQQDYLLGSRRESSYATSVANESYRNFLTNRMNEATIANERQNLRLKERDVAARERANNIREFEAGNRVISDAIKAGISLLPVLGLVV